MEFDQTITILETQRTIHGFKLGKQVILLYCIDNTMVAIAKILSTATFDQLHNQLQCDGYYEVFIHKAIVDESPLMISNTNYNPTQLFVWDAIRTMIA